MSDESKAKAVSEHAEVTQGHRELAGILSDVHYHLSDERTCATCNSDFSDIRHIPAKMRAREYMSQLLADHDAEVERKAEREALIWATGAMSLNERDNAIIQRRIDELEQP